MTEHTERRDKRERDDLEHTERDVEVEADTQPAPAPVAEPDEGDTLEPALEDDDDDNTDDVEGDDDEADEGRKGRGRHR